MRHLETRKAVAGFKRICKAHGIEFTVEYGKGSHVLLVFRDPATRENIRVAITGRKEISPGVQRNVIDHVRTLAGRVALAAAAREFCELVHSVVEDTFKG